VTVAINTAIKHEHRRYFGAPSCPNCGVLIVAAEASEYVGDGHIRHRWLCEDCDYDFRTVVKVSA